MPPVTPTLFHAAHAWLGIGSGSPAGPAADHGDVVRDVLIEVIDGRFATVTANVPAAPPQAIRLSGLVLPGLANTHSHAFHRALRGRTHGGRGNFWTWREQMYDVAARLDPDSYHALARAVYAEMALAGVTCVGEFHYLHHGPDGTPYAEANAMGEALVAAAADAGIRITVLDTLYLTASVAGAPLTGVQRRFGDADLDGWSRRTAGLRTLQAPDGQCRIGAALHSVRAVPARLLNTFAERTAGLPVHVHLSEQEAENEQCLATHGCTPTQLLYRHGVLRAAAPPRRAETPGAGWEQGTGREPSTARGEVGPAGFDPPVTAVHATHLTPADIATLGGTGTGVCLCPSTERDLADGIGPARALANAGSPLSVGSDSHAAIDLFEESRGIELHERLATRRRGHFTAAELLAAATRAGHTALGWGDAGTITVGARADLVTVRLDSARTAGVDPAAAVFVATAADVTDVLIDGRVIVADGRHTRLDVAAELRERIAAVFT